MNMKPQGIASKIDYKWDIDPIKMTENAKTNWIRKNQHKVIGGPFLGRRPRT
jgi:hypothetical protein